MFLYKVHSNNRYNSYTIVTIQIHYRLHMCCCFVYMISIRESMHSIGKARISGQGFNNVCFNLFLCCVCGCCALVLYICCVCVLGVDVVPSWYQFGTNVVPICDQIVTKLWTNLGPSWYQCYKLLVHIWYQFGKTVVPHLVPICYVRRQCKIGF